MQLVSSVKQEMLNVNKKGKKWALTGVGLQDLSALESLFIGERELVGAANRFVDGRVRALNVALAFALHADFCVISMQTTIISFSLLENHRNNRSGARMYLPTLCMLAVHARFQTLVYVTLSEPQTWRVVTNDSSRHGSKDFASAPHSLRSCTVTLPAEHTQYTYIF